MKTTTIKMKKVKKGENPFLKAVWRTPTVEEYSKFMDLYKKYKQS